MAGGDRGLCQTCQRRHHGILVREKREENEQRKKCPVSLSFFFARPFGSRKHCSGNHICFFCSPCVTHLLAVGPGEQHRPVEHLGDSQDRLRAKEPARTDQRDQNRFQK